MSVQSLQSIEALTENIRRVAGLPLEQATTLPPQAFTSPQLLELEKQQIFSTEWVCVGREDDLQAIGDYFTAEINDVPVIVVRDTLQTPRALVNVCRHRMTKIVEGQGNTSVFTCPYHAWSYDLGGQLLKAPRMKNCGFDASTCRLPEVSLEVWMGFIYLNLDVDAQPLSPRLRQFEDLVRPYRIDKMATVWKKTAYWSTNWKVLVENFLESYHIAAVHRHTLYPYGGYSEVEPVDVGESCAFYLQKQKPGDGSFEEIISPAILVENPELTEFARNTTLVGCIFPSLLLSISWFGVMWISVQPVSIGELRIDWGVLGPVSGLARNQSSYDGYSFPELVDSVNAEDKPRTEWVFQGARSGRADSGPLHETHEETILSFIRYLSRRLSIA